MRSPSITQGARFISSERLPKNFSGGVMWIEEERHWRVPSPRESMSMASDRSHCFGSNNQPSPICRDGSFANVSGIPLGNGLITRTAS